MAERVPPSREELAASDKEVWTHALEVASQNLAIDLTTAGLLQHLRHLIVTGRLVDREAIDREGARVTAADVLHCDVSTPEIALILAAALGEEI